MKELIAILAGTANEAHFLRQRLDPQGETFAIIYPEYPVAGLRFSHILVTDSLRYRRQYASGAEAVKIERWFTEVERRRGPDAPLPVHL